MTGIAMGLLRRLERRQRRRIPLGTRIADRAEAILRTEGAYVSAISALAAAEALELAVEHGIRFEAVGFDEDRLHWYATYESGPVRRPVSVRMPLEHATEATQRGVGSMN